MRGCLNEAIFRRQPIIRSGPERRGLSTRSRCDTSQHLFQSRGKNRRSFRLPLSRGCSLWLMPFLRLAGRLEAAPKDARSRRPRRNRWSKRSPSSAATAWISRCGSTARGRRPSRGSSAIRPPHGKLSNLRATGAETALSPTRRVTIFGGKRTALLFRPRQRRHLGAGGSAHHDQR